MQVEMMPTDRLVPQFRKARTPSPDKMAQIAASIAGFGFTNLIPISKAEATCSRRLAKNWAWLFTLIALDSLFVVRREPMA